MKYINFLGGLILLLISFLIPRRKNIWVFGSNMGFCSNAKYLFIHICECTLEIEAYWISSSRAEYNEVKKHFRNVFYRWSFKGIYYSLTAGVYVYNSYVSDINLFTFGNAKKVNLWHGVGLKNIEYNISKGPLSRIFHSKNPITKIKYLWFFVKPNIFLSTSPMMTEHFSSCFRISKNDCIESVYPRCEMFKLEKNQIMNFIKKYEPDESLILANEIAKYQHVYLYMPTFRDSNQDFFMNLGWDLNVTNETLKANDSFLIIKLHPNSVSESLLQYSNIKIVSNKIDIYPILPLTDTLITDYSSIYFDYILLKNKQVILFIPDYQEYLSKDRDLAFDYKTYTKGIYTKSFDELLSFLNDNTEKYVQTESEIDNIRNLFWGNSSDNMDVLLNKIKSLVCNLGH